MSRSKNCRYVWAEGDCDRPDDMSVRTFWTLLSVFIVGFVLFLYFLITLTAIKHRSINKLTPHYIEKYQCGIEYE